MSIRRRDKNELKIISTGIEDEKKNSILSLVNDKRNRYQFNMYFREDDRHFCLV